MKKKSKISNSRLAKKNVKRNNVTNKVKKNNSNILNQAKIKSYSFEELESHYFGKVGTSTRTAYEREFIEDTVAELVKQLRKHFDITQDELATRTGMTKSYISRIENNKKNQNVDTIFKIIRAFNARLFIRLEMDDKPLTEYQLT